MPRLRAVLTALAVIVLSPALQAASTDKPNVVIFLADDQGWGDLSIHGNTNLATPRIDSLAADGALFERFYVCPVCSPTRAEFLTGRYHPRGGVRDVSTGGERLDLDEKTIAVYFSDNGPNSWRWNGGLRGKKGSVDEGGVRSPLFIRWPGKIKAGLRIPQIAAAIDLLPTLTDLVGVERVGEKPLDGWSLKSLLTGAPKVEWSDRMIFSHWNRKISVRTQTHCLDEKGRLYDMSADPGQDRDIAKSEPEIAARLSKAVNAWRAEMMPLLRDDDRPLPVGYREFPVTQLPARDGVLHGNIKRSSSAPNCSYFTNWTQPSDSMTWDLEVATAGRYAVEIYYACPEADLGAEVDLSFRNARIVGTVDKANDPPLRGMENDQVPRKGESYVKDFQPWQIGEIDLEAGRGELTLKAQKIPAAQAMEVRLITLTLRDGEPK